MKTKSIPSCWLESEGCRFDCGPYMSGALEAKVLIAQLRAKKVPLKDVCLNGSSGLVNAGRIKRLWVEDDQHGIRFLSSTDILKSDLSDLQFISKRAANSNPKLLIRSGWTLITRAGTIGRMAYARPDMDNLACSEDVLRVIPDSEKILPGYLYAYLSSKFGVPLIVGGTFGSIIQHIEPQHIANLPVPRLSELVETRAHDLVHGAAALLTDCQQTLDEATSAVFHNTDIWNPTPKEWHDDRSDTAFDISSRNLNVLRAWNHSKRAHRIAASIKNGPWSLLGDLVDLSWLRWRVMFERRDASPEYGIEVITQRPLFQLFPEGRWVSRKYLLNHSPKYIVPDQTILIAKQGTLGEGELYCRTELVTGDRMLARAYSDHCMRIVALRDKVHPGYLFAFLRSNAAFRMLRSLSEGAKQQDLHWRTVPTLAVPRRSLEEEARIGDVVISACQARQQAVGQILSAVDLVELEIGKLS